MGWLKRAYDFLTADPNQDVLDCVLKAESPDDMRARFTALGEERMASWRREPSRLLKAAIKTDDPALLDAVVADFCNGNHNVTIFESATLLPPGSVMCVSALDLLNTAQIAHAQTIVDHMLALPGIHINRRHLGAAQIHGTCEQIDIIRARLTPAAECNAVI